MRFVGIGLLGLLIVVAILLTLNMLQGPVIQTGMQAQDDVSRIAGVDRHTGMKVTESAVLDGVMNGSHLRGVKVVSIVTGGQLDTFYGLIPGDVVTGIVDIGDLSIMGDDPELAIAQVFDACQRSRDLFVTRPGVGKIQLPQDRLKLPPTPPAPAMVLPAPGASPASPQPASPGGQTPPAAGASTPTNPPAPADDRSELQKQLDAISKPR